MTTVLFVVSGCINIYFSKLKREIKSSLALVTFFIDRKVVRSFPPILPLLKLSSVRIIRSAGPNAEDSLTTVPFTNLHRVNVHTY